MIDIKFLRENPDAVRENIKKKFQDAKLPLVDEVIEYDAKSRAAQQEADQIRADKKKISKQIGILMKQGKKEEAQAIKDQVADNSRLDELDKIKKEADEIVRKDMMLIPQIIDPSVPLGPDDSCNVEIEKFGEPVVPDFEVPYHTDIMKRFNGIDLDAAGDVAGNGFYYLMGNIARLHSAVISYARDFMINKGFTYCVPPFMIRSRVVTGVMSFAEMDAMMYKIEGEDLYLIGTSEHSMIGKFIDQIIPEEKLPQTLTSYSPCFRKEKGAHGIEERGVYRIHQFEKQEMIVVCKPEESMDWYNKMSSAAWISLSAHSSAAPATWLTSRSNPVMSRHGLPARRNTSRSAAAPTSATHRHAVCRSASAARRAKNILPTPSTTLSWLRPAC